MRGPHSLPILLCWKVLRTALGMVKGSGNLPNVLIPPKSTGRGKGAANRKASLLTHVPVPSSDAKARNQLYSLFFWHQLDFRTRGYR